MCGIVVYYGDAENRLTRILTGMWAIIYRAPDSTGIGLLGNDLEPLRIRRELGSVENLIDRLLVEPVFDETEIRAASALTRFTADGTDDHGAFVADRQAALLAFEGFAVPENPDYPSWSVLTDTVNIRELQPGSPGNPRIQETFSIDSPKALKSAIHRMVEDFDLPLSVVEKLILKGYEAEAAVLPDTREQNLPLADLVQEFRQIFNRFAYDEAGNRPRRIHQTSGQKHPYARKYAWRILRRVRVILPPDFTTDGVTVLFRYLESCMLASHTRDTADRIQQIFHSFWEIRNTARPPKWQTLFAAEKAANVYGIAAASVMACFQTGVYMKQAGETNGFQPRGHVPGPTHPSLLRFMSQPVIGQGRWAIQSAISVRNAHPFTDRNQKRSVVLNGQFDSGVESRITEYLTQVAGYRLRTDNSTELFAMLWGLYFDTAYWESRRYLAIEEQHRLGLEELSISSQSIDYTVFKNLTGRSIHELDEMAFIRAMEAMIPDGGQFAVSGISRISPDRLFLAAHKRPVYIVKRLDTDDFMVVSDINAALGLFSQSLIQSTARKLRKLMQTYSKKSVIVEPDFFDIEADDGDSPQTGDDWFRREKMKLLAPFRVDVYALDGPRLFATIRTKAVETDVMRELSIRDFSGKRRSDIRPEQTLLTPLAFHKDFGLTFYEEHLREIPGLLRDTLDRVVDTRDGLPSFAIRRRMIERRFGGNLAELNRIILVGTGFTYTLAEIVEKTMEQFFSGVNIIAATPLEIGRTFINPDRDLVVMMSWSGTTSDMIDAAARMLKRNVLMVGITEKPFSDLALVVRKSAGVIPVYSGEEVTVAPLKSAVCMLMTLDLFCIWLAGGNQNGTGNTVALTGEMRQIPDKLAALLADGAVDAFCRDSALAYQNTRRHYIMDAFHDIGAAKTGVLNLEVNAWASMGNALDYSEVEEFIDTPMGGDEFILVNATNRKRIGEAMGVMTALKAAGRPFVAACAFNREQGEIESLANRAVFLPDLPDYFQPFVDLPFMFLLGFYYGLAHGRMAGEMPRNMAKSVTAGRTKGGGDRTAADILDELEAAESALDLPAPVASQYSEDKVWIREADTPAAAAYYQDLVRLGQILTQPDPYAELFESGNPLDVHRLARLIFEHLAEDGGMIFVPMDRQAEAACRNFIRVWEPLLDIPLQVEFPEKLKGASTEDCLVVTVASEPVAGDRLSVIVDNAGDHLLWIGPGDSDRGYDAFIASCGAGFLSGRVNACPHEHIYAALTLFFCRIMATLYPDRSERLVNHFRLMAPMLDQMLGSRELLGQISRAVVENQGYEKQLFVSGFRGNCTAWQTAAEGRAPAGVECEPFGVSAYHHLVLVDPRVPEKFVKIEPRGTMLARYTEADIRAWETRFLGGATADDFLSESSMPCRADAVLPFLMDDQWYLPVLNPHYDRREDCLVTIDATSAPQFDSALDELATFGSRYARTVVITQQGFTRDARLGNLKKYPLGHLILVPGLPDTAGNPVVWPDFLMPVAVNLVGTAMAYGNLKAAEKKDRGVQA